jgi:HAD superfamily hydrolase (TIGR01490 family)
MYRFAALDMHSLAEKALATMIGMAESEFEQQMHAFFQNTLLQYVPRRAQAVVDEHRDQGHKLVLLTSASTHESRAAVAHFGLDDYICSRFEVDPAGRFTGKAMAPVCYGQGKVTLVEPWAKEHHIDLSRSYFYSDSFSDAPMLERVGHPRVVNPDVRLLIMAKRRGWPVVDFH